jgi:hypothetical protein
MDLIAALQSELLKLLVPLVASGALAGLRTFYPQLKSKVPSLLWPLALYGFARLGVAACGALDVQCNARSPFDWSPETINAMVAAFAAIVLHRVTKSVKSGELLAKAKDLFAKLPKASD